MKLLLFKCRQAPHVCCSLDSGRLLTWLLLLGKEQVAFRAAAAHMGSVCSHCCSSSDRGSLLMLLLLLG